MGEAGGLFKPHKSARRRAEPLPAKINLATGSHEREKRVGRSARESAMEHGASRERERRRREKQRERE